MISYNTLPTLLSGHSLLAQLDHVDPERYRFVAVFNRPCEGEEEVRRRGIRTVVLPHGGGGLLRRAWQYVSLPFRLCRLARVEKPALICADNVMAGRPAVALKALTGIPVVIQIRNVGLPTRTGVFIRRADAFAAVSAAAVDGTLTEKHKGRATVVFDGFDLGENQQFEHMSQHEAREALGLPTDIVIVGMAGRLSPQKGQRQFVHAANRAAQARPGLLFAHAGGIPRQESSSEYVRDLASSSAGLCEAGHFRWLDYISRISLFWRAVDIAVVPSCGPEAFGRVVLEAMAMRRPVVATCSGGPEEILVHRVSGLLVPMADSQALYSAIVSLADCPSERDRIGASARRAVEEQFSAERYAQRMVEVYDSLLDAPQRRSAHD